MDSSHNVCTTALTDMNDLFKNNTTFNEDINSWDVSNVERMASMFN
ncbi:MAG: BspA family leucine-rich repeat surface protein [Patescibacteria group bacterium]|nr:BspA family leucine-rich repeat surface protein [Patescibacteria group bacterium]